MIPIVLAGVSAAVWGIADFSGGKASQRASPLGVTVISQLCGVPALVLLVLLVPGAPRPVDLAWGVGAGVAGFFGIVLLYRALSAGAMAVVAPVTAVTAALVPVAVGLLTDHLPGPLALGGAACALVAIALVSLGPSAGTGAVGPRLIGPALAAGALFGAFFALVGQVGAGAGMWPLLAARFASISVGLLLMLRTAGSWRLNRATLVWVLLAGVLDNAANALYIAAAARGHLSIVAAIAALYPASTVVLALAVDRERTRFLQVIGLGLAAAALVLASA